MTSKLFQPITIGDIKLSHRVVLAPCTRLRVDANHVPHIALVKEYYSQRASEPGTLLITEATLVHPRAGGQGNVPGIWSDDQTKAWKEGSFIYLQLWALGRAAHPERLQGEVPPYPYVSASDIPMSGRPMAPRPLTVEEIEEYVQFFAEAAVNAVQKAGFDGVEVHGANGYLMEQFLKEASNKRTDSYGGSAENRARFALEVVDAVVKAVGPRKTGLRLSPWNTYQDTDDQDPVPTYSYLVKELKRTHPNLAYLHVADGPVDNGVGSLHSHEFIREIWTKGPGGNEAENGRRLISAGNFNLDTGAEIADTKGDLVAYGRRFLANPDLPYRLRQNISLNPHDAPTFYVAGSLDPKGYTDYPFASRRSVNFTTHL
ncbi:hypothetical protein PM082_010281 [Marasmius tenuissimus]|nr:hypothetical protein PM082_010281 [Marasmius tenuissimus]